MKLKIEIKKLGLLTWEQAKKKETDYFKLPQIFELKAFFTANLLPLNVYYWSNTPDENDLNLKTALCSKSKNEHHNFQDYWEHDFDNFHEITAYKNIKLAETILIHIIEY